MGDIISFLLELNELKELRYELEINDKFFNDIETEDNRGMPILNSMGTKKDTCIMRICANSLLH